VLDITLARISRLIGKPPGWERVVRALAPPRQFTGAPVQAAEQAEGFVFPVDRGTLIGWSVHFFGTYEPEVRAEVSRLRPGDVAIDIGANVGWHTLLMAARVGPAGRVYAFEPNRTTRDRLAAAVASNGLSQVTIDPRAVADREEPRAFQAPAAGHVWDGTGRLMDEAREGEQTVACTTLDRFVTERGITRLALVKIDVEGWEPAVVRGARQTLRALRPRIVFEFDPAYVSRCGGSGGELLLALGAADYAVQAIIPGRAPASVSSLGDRCGNFLAVPREHVESL
jgi:FkbM family methyltransferase